MIRNLITKLRHHFRSIRYNSLSDLLDLAEYSQGYIIDLGGGPASFFAALYPNPQAIILIELEYDLAQKAKKRLPDLNVIVADGEKLPFARQSVSATICNSVIEHVNMPSNLANEIQRVSQRFFVQTPNVRFPVETHSYIAIPLYNQIPWIRLRRLLCYLFGGNYDYISSVYYLSEKELRRLFPQANLYYEKSLGLKKSFYLVQKSGKPT